MDKPETKNLSPDVQEKVAQLDAALTTLDASRNAMLAVSRGMSFGGAEHVTQSVVSDVGKSTSHER